MARQITIKRGDANKEVQRLCKKDWSSHRAVLFLDPYGMQVEWQTLVAIAGTRGIDLWILFPYAIAVNRLLKHDGEICLEWKNRLDLLFGSSEWMERFYRTEREFDLFGERDVKKREASPEAIGTYFLERLRSIFPAVANNPLPLDTPDGRPLYLLCFAAANERGAKLAVRIAQDILKR